MDNTRSMRTANQGLRIGRHYIGGKQLITGLGQAMDEAASAMQLFAGNPRRYWGGKVAPEATELWNEKSQGMYKMVHSVYILNILDNPETRSYRMSKHSLLNQLKWCDEHSIDAFVFHPGSPLDADRDDARQWMRNAIGEVLLEYEGSTRLCLENAAISRDKWGKSKYTGDIEELRDDVNQIISDFDTPHRPGIVIDTTHAYASGYSVEAMAGAMDALGQLDLLEAIHFNQPDDHVLLNGGHSHDRHASTFDQGRFTLRQLWSLFKSFRKYPLILEGTPDLPADMVHMLRWELDLRNGHMVPPTSSVDLGPLFDTEGSDDSSNLP